MPLPHGRIVAPDMILLSSKDSRDQASSLLKCMASSLSVLTTQHSVWPLFNPLSENLETRSLVTLNLRKQRRGILNSVFLRALLELSIFCHQPHITTGLWFKTLLMVISTFVFLNLNKYKKIQCLNIDTESFFTFIPALLITLTLLVILITLIIPITSTLFLYTLSGCLCLNFLKFCI